MKSTKRTSDRRPAMLGVSVIALTALLASSAFAAPPLSDATKVKISQGHWGGTYGQTWVPGPYEKPYTVHPPLGGAAEQKTAQGHWTGTYGSVWKPGAYQKPYTVKPQLSASTAEKMNRGHWTGGGGGMNWIPASAKK